MAEEYTPLLNTGPQELPPEGFPFTAESALRQDTEPAAFFMVPSIATRAVTHNRIAPAVINHSEFLIHPWGRLLGTSGSGLTLTMEGLTQALTKGRDIFELHKTINGELDGVAYDANDSRLQMWVLDCIDHGIEEASRRFYRPLNEEQRSAIWDDVYTFGRWFGVASKAMPKTYQELLGYRGEMLNGTELLRTDASRDLLQQIFEFHSAKVPLPVARLGQAITKLSIEPELLDRAGVEITRFDRVASGSFDWTMQQTYARLPKHAREQAIPVTLAAQRKLQQAFGHVATAGAQFRKLAARG